MKRMLPLGRAWLGITVLALMALYGSTVKDAHAATQEIGRYRLFERAIENDRAYANKFADVQLRCRFTAPSGREVVINGFFDGDGKGSGDAASGNVWKMRHMPDELGSWSYRWWWSDGAEGGSGQFACVNDGQGKGLLRPYAKNPRWLAYNGTEPVWVKSYYETGHGSIAQPFEWVAKNVYQPILDRGYNHLQVNWLLSLCCAGQYYTDGPAPSVKDLTLYQEGRASSTMRLDVWRMMERHLGWLNDRDVSVHMFLGFEGRKNDGPSWEKLSREEQEFYVRYAVARLAPYANIAGWNFVWEDPGHRESHELGWARLIEKYDVYNHLRAYEDEHPRDHEYNRPEYTFAPTENHYITAPTKPLDRIYRKTPWTHHQACLLAYVPGKPVYMSEGNALWRRYWQARTGATQDDLRRAAWGCATAGASFCWNGHAKEYGMTAFGPEGLPFHGDDNPYTRSARYVDILADVMTNEIEFYRAAPQDFLLTEHDPLRVWCLAESGKQYLAFAGHGEPFTLHVTPGDYTDNVWIDAKTGDQQPVAPQQVDRGRQATEFEDDRLSGTRGLKFQPPNRETDWVLLLRTK